MISFFRTAFLTALFAACFANTAVAQVPPTWSGYYIGVHGGFASGTDKNPFEPTSGNGALFGAHAGHNWLAGSLLYGFEGEINLGGPHIEMSFGRSIFDERVTASGSLRGRIGLPVNDWLFFATGGYALAAFKQNVTLFPRFAPPEYAFGNHLLHGYVIGAGVERFFARNWSLRAEYHFTSLIGRFDPLITTTGRLTGIQEVDLHVHMIRFGATYRFGTN